MCSIIGSHVMFHWVVGHCFLCCLFSRALYGVWLRMVLGVLCSLIFLGVPFLYCSWVVIVFFNIIYVCLTGLAWLEFMISDFSPVPFVFIKMRRQLLEGRRAWCYFLFAAIQTMAIGGEIENLSFDDSSILWWECIIWTLEDF